MKYLRYAALGLILGFLTVGAGIGAISGFLLALPFIVAIKATKAAKALPAAVAVLRGPKGIWTHRLFVAVFVLCYPVLFLVVGLVHAAREIPTDWRDLKRAWAGYYLKVKTEVDAEPAFVAELLPEREPELPWDAQTMAELIPEAVTEVEPEVPAPANDAPEAVPLAA